MIYVDSPKTYGTHLPYKVWSHLWSDTSVEQLHAMAHQLGLKRKWFQQHVGPNATEAGKLTAAHYDVTPSKRWLALELGAKPMELREFYKQQLAQVPQ